MNWKMVAVGVGIRAPVLQPHEAVPLPPLVPEFRQVRRAPLRRTDFEQFGYTDNCPGCANARAGRRQAADHSEQCRSRMEAILVTTTEGHMRLDRALGVMESSRKRHRPDGKGEQPLAPSASGVRSNYQEGSSSSCPALPPAPPPLDTLPLAKRSLEQETKMTDATVKQQGESKRRREHPEVPQAADSSSSSESSTDTNGLSRCVYYSVCGISTRWFTGKPVAVAEGREGGNSEVSERDGVTGKPAAVAEGREGGPTTLELTTWDFNIADCRTRCRKLIEN